MSDPFLGEIRLFAFGFAPDGWAQCNGQLLPIALNTALFSLIGTTYGGNGITHFALPDLQDRVAIHQGPTFARGTSGGEIAHTLTVAELPGHTHQANGSPDEGNTILPNGGLWAVTSSPSYNQTSGAPMSPAAIGSTGGGQPHNNMQPFLTLNYCIALEGIFPSMGLRPADEEEASQDDDRQGGDEAG